MRGNHRAINSNPMWMKPNNISYADVVGLSVQSIIEKNKESNTIINLNGCFLMLLFVITCPDSYCLAHCFRFELTTSSIKICCCTSLSNLHAIRGF